MSEATDYKAKEATVEAALKTIEARGTALGSRKAVEQLKADLADLKGEKSNGNGEDVGNDILKIVYTHPQDRDLQKAYMDIVVAGGSKPDAIRGLLSGYIDRMAKLKSLMVGDHTKNPEYNNSLNIQKTVFETLKIAAHLGVVEGIPSARVNVAINAMEDELNKLPLGTRGAPEPHSAIVLAQEYQAFKKDGSLAHAETLAKDIAGIFNHHPDDKALLAAVEKIVGHENVKAFTDATRQLNLEANNSNFNDTAAAKRHDKDVGTLTNAIEASLLESTKPLATPVHTGGGKKEQGGRG